VNAVPGKFQVADINQAAGFEGLAGHSHIPLFFADNFDFASRPVISGYEYLISLLAAAGNGYQVTAAFQLQPMPWPAIWAVTALDGLFIGNRVWARRRARLAD
jgi:hypothetical protein